MQSLDELLSIVRRLRAPDGCSWDRKQTLESMRSDFLEEVHEFVEGVDERDAKLMKEEAGDLFFHLVFFSELAREQGWFDADAAIRGVCEKLISRHPHVFERKDGEAAIDEAEVLRRWEARKQKENVEKKRESILQGIPRALPSLVQATQIQEKASHVGFDWDGAAGVLDKLDEEVRELKEAITRRKAPDGRHDQAVEDELGDLLFTVVNLSRHLSVDADRGLSRTNARFKARFAHMENALKEAGAPINGRTLAEWDVLWEKAKNDHP
jgi:MazG family protein